MPRGFFTQSAMVLFTDAPSIDRVAAALATDSVTRRSTEPGWISGGAELLVPFGGRGHVHVDVVGAPWPDAMEDANDPSLFAAWSMGAFGPLAYPGGLRRAVQQAAAFPEATSDAHRAFVRLRTSYLVGAGEESAVLPDDWSALGELAALLRMASPLLALEGACAFFDPNAEVVLAPGAFRALMAESEGGEPSLELFTSVRHFVVDERWSLMDTVGMERFFLPDFEALIPTGTDPSEMAELLRDACAYLLSEGAVIEDGHSIEGPGEMLKVRARDASVADPPRRVLQLVPDGAVVPELG